MLPGRLGVTHCLTPNTLHIPCRRRAAFVARPPGADQLPVSRSATFSRGGEMMKQTRNATAAATDQNGSARVVIHKAEVQEQRDLEGACQWCKYVRSFAKFFCQP